MIFLCPKHSIYIFVLFNPFINPRRLSNFPSSQSNEGQSHSDCPGTTKVKLPQAACSAVRETSPSYTHSALPNPISPFSHSDNSTLISAPRTGSAWALPHSSVFCLQESTKFPHNHVHANKDTCTHPYRMHVCEQTYLSTHAQTHSSPCISRHGYICMQHLCTSVCV